MLNNKTELIVSATLNQTCFFMLLRIITSSSLIYSPYFYQTEQYYE